MQTPVLFPVYEESHYQATDNKTCPTTGLDLISSAGWWLCWDTAAGMAQAAKQASGHGHKNVPPIASLSLTCGLKWSLFPSSLQPLSPVLDFKLPELEIWAPLSTWILTSAPCLKGTRALLPPGLFMSVPSMEGAC